MITHARRTPDLEFIRALFLEYEKALDFNLCFQDFERELSELPGDYAPPGGCLLLLWEGEAPVGCVAVRQLSPGIGEMKRLYVKPAFRGKGFGRRLAETAAAEAFKVGHKRLRLDTVPSMQDAIALYRQMGFREIPPYRENPIPGALYLELDLKPPKPEKAAPPAAPGKKSRRRQSRAKA